MRNRISQAINLGRWAQAQSMLAIFLPDNERDSECWYWLGLCQANQNQFMQAAGSFNRCLELKPKYALALNALGRTLLQLEQIDEAIKSFQAAIKVNPKLSQNYLYLGSAFRKQKKNEKAVICLSKGLRIKPNDVGILNELGNIYMEQGKYEKAESSLRKAIKLKNNFGAAYIALGRLMQYQKKPEQSLENYKQATACFPNNPEPWVNYGLMQEKMHHLSDAKASCIRALEIAKNHPGANLLFARLSKRNSEYEEARDHLSAIPIDRLPPSQASGIASELGHVLDKLNDYDAAFTSFTRGNQAWIRVLQNAGVDMHSFPRHIDANLAFFTRANTSDWDQVEIKDHVPSPIFLVGFPRSGTTLMEQILESHPDLIGSREETWLLQVKENIGTIVGRDFNYPEDLVHLDADEISDIRKHYWKLAQQSLGESLNGKRLVDKLPLNIVELGMIYRLFPDARIIVALRDPRDCCLSCFMQAFEINQAMSHFLDLETTTSLYNKVMNLWLHYKQELTLQAFDYRYEDLVDDLPSIAHKVIEFVGEEWTDEVLQYHEKAKQRYANTPSYQAVTQPIYKSAMNRWKHYEKFISPYEETLLPFIEKFGYSTNDK